MVNGTSYNRNERLIGIILIIAGVEAVCVSLKIILLPLAALAIISAVVLLLWSNYQNERTYWIMEE